MYRFILFVGMMLLFQVGQAQTCQIQPIGKILQTFAEGEPALNAVINPTSVTEDQSGNIYFIDRANLRVRRLSPDGTLNTVAGNGLSGWSGDSGPARQARINPVSIAVSPEGVLYVADDTNRIRKVGEDGRIITVAGTGVAAFNYEDGNGPLIHLNDPTGLFYGHDGNLYFADRGNNRVRKLTPEGTVHTVAGSIRSGTTLSPEGWVIPSEDEGDGGPANMAYVPSPQAVFQLPDGRLVINDYRFGDRIRVIELDGTIRLIFRSFDLTNVRMSSSGELYMAMQGNSGIQLYRISLDGEMEATSSWPVSLLTSNAESVMGTDFYFLSGDRLIVPRTFRVGFQGQGIDSTLTPGGLWIASSGGASQRIAGKRLTLDPVIEGPASATYLPSRKIVTRADGGVYLLTDDAVYLVDRNQQVRRVFGGGTDAGDPEGKNPVNLRARVLDLTVTGTDEFIVATGTPDVSFLRVAANQARQVRAQNGEVVRIQIPQVPDHHFIEYGMDGTLYVLQASGGITETVVHTIRTNGQKNQYQAWRLKFPVRMPDGKIIASSVAGFVHYQLTPTGMGERMHLLDGIPHTRLSFSGNQIYVSPEKETPSLDLLKRNISGTTWEKLSLSQFSTGPSWIGDFVGAGPDGALILSDMKPNLWMITNPAGCSLSAGPVVKAGNLINSANYANPDTIAPGQIVSLFGENLGPADGHGMYLDKFVNWMPPPEHFPGLALGFIHQGTLYSYNSSLIYGNSTQMNVQAPFQVLDADRTYSAYLTWNGVMIPYPTSVSLKAANPGLFVVGGQKDGQGAILNQDGTANSPANPAPVGSFVALFATGMGRYDQEQQAGNISPQYPLPRVKANVAVTIGGQPAHVDYAGGAPGLTTGLTQINVLVPDGISGPELEVELLVDGVSTSGTQRVTMAVQ